jgi:hypothetical protein
VTNTNMAQIAFETSQIGTFSSRSTHCETFNTCWEIGQQQASTGGVTILNLTGQPTDAGRSFSSLADAVDISANYNTTDVTLISTKRNTGPSNALINNQNGDTLNSSCDGTVAFYAWDISSGNSAVSTTSCTAQNRIGAGGLAIGGTATAVTPATGDSSSKIATTAYVQAQAYLTAVPTCPMWLTQPHASSTVSFSSSANKASLWGVVLSCTLATTQITYDVSTADNTANTYDIGIVNSSGTVVAHVGSTAGTTFAPSTGWKTLSWATAATLPPGKYYLAITSSCTSSCAVLEGGSSGVGFTFAGNQAVSVTTGGTLPATVTPPSDAYTATTIPVWSVH